MRANRDHTHSRFASRAFVAGLISLVALAMPAQTTQPAVTSGSDALARTLEAHGGLANWQAQGAFTYTLNGFPLSPQVAEPNTATVDMRRRHHRIDSAGFTIGFDGVHVWSVPSPEAVGLPPRFFVLGSFYFVGMPFVFADPGVVVEVGGAQVFRGEEFPTLLVHFAQGVGHTDEDEYVLFLDPDTSTLRLINHTVSENPDIDRVTWVLDEWQEIAGLRIPARMTFFPGWNPDDPGEGASFTIEDAEFRPEAPESALFAPPADAVIE